MPPAQQASPNEQYLTCLAYFIKQAEARGAKAAHAYRSAYAAINKCSVVLATPADAQRLKGIGPAIVAKIQKWFETHPETEPALQPTHAKGHSQKKKRATKKKADAKEKEKDDKVDEAREAMEMEAPQQITFTPTIFEPGTFDIVLVVDTREIKDQDDRQYFSRELQSHGIQVDKRQLELGDVIWVARRRDDGAELVLDYIIERKRMDDLVSSIKEGRFHEQKTRLAASGAARVVYIIEKYTSAEVDAFNPQAIQTAISTTQVIDGFFIKRTNSTAHTVFYLVLLHTALLGIYSTQRLHGIPDEHVDRNTFLKFKKHLTTPHFVSFNSYRMLNSKAGSVTLQSSFAVMLATVRGVSSAKAAEIAQKYRTPHRLLMEYSKLDNDEDRLAMVRRAMKCTITLAASKNIWETWYTTQE